MSKIKTIVLVHGFWIDASSYSQVILSLLSEGYEVIAVQNPLTSLADDIAATKRALDRMDGQCLLVGHSWGGTVITEVGNDDRVAGLVYIAALAPDEGESMIDLLGKYGSPPPQFQEHNGFIWISKEGVEQILANDLPEENTALIYATQVPPSTALLEAKVGSPAWRNKPSWYLIANDDNSLPAELQRNLSQRMGATTMAIDSNHVAMISHPEAVLELIRQAATHCSTSCSD